ncbi:uncharacterized protein LOC106157849 isoform X2 [Lingula anatina]|uniref:Uncharacterized protein LOC106157849 isoform X2 n=1 Tax=Lingula anatina TaxID=7574 RepID=A0A1S3HSR9_LINAN|nr:uncharacterized protein LOC106157849 isoform X2 [Lingula anatina]|eukprot:XP_013389082.1 uncharacterized protein LOC106157849 isoform X2 [Lingula anatina]
MNATKDKFEVDPFLCTCGPCKRFWKDNFDKNGAILLEQPVPCRATDTSTLYKQYHENNLFNIGDRVIVWGKYRGVVKFIGLLDVNAIAPETYVGVHLDDHIGSVHNGVYDGKRYFHCPRGHGAFVPYGDCRPIQGPEPRPPVTGNDMFPSYEEVKKSRKLKKERELEAERIKAEESSRYGVTDPKLLARRRAAKRIIFDPNDITVRDAKRREAAETRRRQILAAQPRLTANEKKLLKWKEEFGGDTRAEYMVKTLEKLMNAHEDGKQALEDERIARERAEMGYSDDESDYDDASTQV